MAFDNPIPFIGSTDPGTNRGTTWTRPSTVPASSPTLLVTQYQYQYNATGLVEDVTDPMGIDTRTYYDDLGRVTKTIQDYTGGNPGTENDITTEYGYDGNNNVTYVQADEPGGSYQKTAYVYGVTTAAGDGVNSNDILSAVQHPDPSTGNPSSSQQDSYLVNALGQVVQYTDRNGSIHQYSYDVLGRITSDAVTTLGAGVDGSVRRIEYGYDSQGNLSLITSYDAATGGNIVNQVEDVYNGLGQLTGEYQSHSGAVVQGTTPVVQYTYTEMSGGQNNSRLTSMTYPSGYVLNYNYNTGLDSNISRLSSISDSSGTLESYLYLGLNTVVERDHPQTNVNQTFISQNGQTGDAGDQYTGLDRFGRVVDQNWYNTTTLTSTDRFQYGYNQDSNVLYRQNLVDAVMSELYQYDNLGQLTSFARGTLNANDTGISGTPSRSQSWTPDALGNFTGVTTNGTAQTRTANQQNEYTSISGSGTITYDANGNLTADGNGNTYVYDAWNRLVAVKNGSTTLASYSYDGFNRRITETHGSTTTDLYYSSNWQVLEERNNGQLQARYVWSPTGTDMLVLRDDSSQNNGTLDRRLYIQQDMLGNVTALVDTSGNVVERYDYDAFGAVTVLNPDFSVRGTSSYNWNYFFQGKRYDGTVGLYHSRERVYSPTLMRPLQADPLGFGNTQWFLIDNRGSIRQVVDHSKGNLFDSITYNPSGNLLNQINAAGLARIAFTGAAIDSNTGNRFFWARSFNPADGKFMSQDFQGFVAGNTNLYSYALNSPLNFIDPLGLYTSSLGSRTLFPHSSTPPPFRGPFGNISPNGGPIGGIFGGYLFPPPGFNWLGWHPPPMNGLPGGQWLRNMPYWLTQDQFGNQDVCSPDGESGGDEGGISAYGNGFRPVEFEGIYNFGILNWGDFKHWPGFKWLPPTIKPINPNGGHRPIL